MFLSDEEIELRFVDKPAAYYAAFIHGAAIGTVSAIFFMALFVVLSA